MTHPKGSMCMSCVKKTEKCDYDFNQMPIIEKYKFGNVMHFVVKCIYYEKAAK